MLRLSVLDQSPVARASTGAQALANTLDLARLADELGYHRYWLAEHHGGPMLRARRPEALIAPVAAATERLRVGSGGVMLPHYSPFKVAETFSMLAGLFPGRIDLGVGRAAGHRRPDDLRAPARPQPGRAGRLPVAARRAPRVPRRHDAATTPVPPTSPRALPGLRSAPSRGCWALRRRAPSGRPSSACPYAFADFINRDGAAIAGDYRRTFIAVALARRTPGRRSQSGRSPRTARTRRCSWRPRAG